MAFHLDDLIHGVHDPGVLFLRKLGSDLPVGRGLVVSGLVDPVATSVSIVTIYVIPCPANQHQNGNLCDSILRTLVGDFIQGFPNSRVDGSQSLAPAHLRMDVPHSWRWCRCDDVSEANHLATLWVVRVVDKSRRRVTNDKHIDLTFRWAIHMSKDSLGHRFEQLQNAFVGFEVLFNV